MNRAARFLRLAAEDRRLLLEASVLLLAARVAVRLAPFRWIAHVVSRAPTTREMDDARSQALIQRVRWAVGAGARHGIGRAVCFPQGIAAQVMLARRGVPSTLHYGVAKTAAGGLEAHVWVRAGSVPVVGCDIADQFTLMVSFPRPIPDASAARPAR